MSGAPACNGVHATAKETAETVTVNVDSGPLPGAVGRMCTMFAVDRHPRRAAAGTAR